MISVTISINGSPIYTRSAVNKGSSDDKSVNNYANDDGTIIKHNPDDGAVVLAIKMLETIKEVK